MINFFRVSYISRFNFGQEIRRKFIVKKIQLFKINFYLLNLLLGSLRRGSILAKILILGIKFRILLIIFIFIIYIIIKIKIFELRQIDFILIQVEVMVFFLLSVRFVWKIFFVKGKWAASLGDFLLCLCKDKVFGVC